MTHRRKLPEYPFGCLDFDKWKINNSMFYPLAASIDVETHMGQKSAGQK